ncbi:hypothetical protein BGZ99_005160 [Dissophora globulifera]|uniref:CCHC-type domain-containing protein n=1 Tax=Dissophora globulifera TaxID=979702 RepID=A0A9P6UTT5_9FUNG|nr:hypothetical protein BGZ99_005160 [Dissophora globulifera]
MASVKVLVVGSANGDLRNLCSKVGTIHAKHGPFDILFCTGNFFAKETPIETIDDLLENKLEFPMTTYFVHGDNGVPGIIERTALRKQGEVCNNLFYLGTHGIMTTAQSVKMASLSGTYDSVIYEASAAELDDEDFDKFLLQGRYTKSTVDALIQAAQPTSIMDTSKRGVDILLTHEWPAGINKPGPGPSSNNTMGMTPPPPAQETTPASTFSHPVARAVAALQPRYHFAASSGQFWERQPYRNSKDSTVQYATRFIGLGEVGNKNKQRWFYAFNLVPLALASEEVLRSSVNAATTESPLANVPDLKRPHQPEEAGSFFWDNKRARNEPPTGYVCRRCNQPGHFIKDCTVERQPNQHGQLSRPMPEGYICNKCNEPGHYIKDCPKIKEEIATGVRGGQGLTGGDRPLPEGYLCNICKQPGHWIQDCPESAARRQQQSEDRSGRPKGKNAPPPPPCWFCLSNPEVDKNLIVSIGTEMYLTMAKGQLPETGAATSLVPGGGHLLLITINHYSSLRTVDAAARKDLENELSKYKDGLRKMFASKGAAMVTWELSQGGRLQHAHLQILAVPQNKVDAIEAQFREDVASFFLASFPPRHGEDKEHAAAPPAAQDSQAPNTTAAWQDHVPSASSSTSNDGYLKIELPNKMLVCPIPDRQRVDAQFGRSVLAKALGMPERANWRSCVKTSDEERKDTQAFKLAFKNFDFTL